MNVSSESKDLQDLLYWAEGCYLESGVWLQVKHGVQDKREGREEEVTHASQT